MSWTTQDLAIEEAATIVIVPENVIDDSEINLWAEIEARCAEAIARLIDATCFFGVAPGGGLIPASFPVGGIYGRAVGALNEVQAGTGIDLAADINDTLGMVEADGFDASRAYSGTGVRANLRGLRDANGQPIYAAGLAGGTTANTIYGVPISYLTGQGVWDPTKSTMIVGDPNMAVIGMRQALTAKQLDQATVGDVNLAEQDALALRVKMRMGFTILAPKVPGGTGNEFPFATLTPAVAGP
jgi:HK97 family phage major capsid protein